MELRPYQSDLVDKITQAAADGHRRILAVMPTGSGKCLGRGTPVLMFDGTIKTVENIVVNDLLMGPDSVPRRVVSLAQGREAMYRISPKKGEAYVVNGSHILSLRMTPGNRIGFLDDEIINISVREYLAKNKTFKHCAKAWGVGVNFSPQKPLPLDPYFLGVWYGDGTKKLTLPQL